MKTDFFEMVYQVVRLIPYGRVTTYGAIARYIGAARAARMVGYAMNCSHTQLIYVPAHRVVNRTGCLTGKHHFAYPSQMEELLIAEGHKIINNQIQNFKDVFWDPEKELKI
jgi:methylated-DNA-protein-cysteine methyltransferase-like protein